VVEHEPATYDYAFWAHRLVVPNSSHLPSRSIVHSFGLQHTADNGRGRISFEDDNVKDLQIAAAEVALTLPQSEHGLVDVADSLDKLHEDVRRLLARFGDVVWGGSHENQTESPSDSLFHANPEDRVK
jgi:hypothetical protein